MNCDVIIVGGGIVGLATAYRLLEARPQTRLLLLEKEPRLAAHQTGNNSGVLHSGLYYKPGSEKAKLSVSGLQQMLDFCRAHGIAHEQWEKSLSPLMKANCRAWKIFGNAATPTA